MFGIPVRCYQFFWVAAHLSTPCLLQSFGPFTRTHKRKFKAKDLTNVDKVQKSFYFIIRDVPLIGNGKKTEALLLSENNFITYPNVVNQVQVWLVCVCFSFFFSFRCLHVNELALKGSFKEPC